MLAPPWGGSGGLGGGLRFLFPTSPGMGSKKAELALIACCLIRLLRRSVLRCFPRQAGFQGGHEIDDGAGAAIPWVLTVSPLGVFELIIPGNFGVSSRRVGRAG